MQKCTLSSTLLYSNLYYNCVLWPTPGFERMEILWWLWVLGSLQRGPKFLRSHCSSAAYWGEEEGGKLFNSQVVLYSLDQHFGHWAARPRRLTFTWWECSCLCFFYVNQQSLPIPFYSVHVSISVFVALSTVFYSINSPDNSSLSHSVLPVLCLPYRSFQFYISLWKSPSALI